MLVHPAEPGVWDRIIANRLFQSANPYSGRRLRGLLAGAGLSVLDETAATWIEAQSGATNGLAA